MNSIYFSTFSFESLNPFLRSSNSFYLTILFMVIPTLSTYHQKLANWLPFCSPYIFIVPLKRTLAYLTARNSVFCARTWPRKESNTRPEAKRTQMAVAIAIARATLQYLLPRATVRTPFHAPSSLPLPLPLLLPLPHATYLLLLSSVLFTSTFTTQGGGTSIL